MLINYNIEAIEALPKSPVIVLPSIDGSSGKEDFVFYSKLMAKVLESRPDASFEFSDKDASDPNVFVIKRLTITEDMVLPKASKEAHTFHYKVNPSTGDIIVVIYGASYAKTNSNKFVQVVSSSDLLLTDAAEVVLTEDEVEQIEDIKKGVARKFESIFSTKFKKGDTVVVRPVTEVRQLSQIRQDEYIPWVNKYFNEGKTKYVYEGQVEYYQNMRATVKTAHKDGTYTLEFGGDTDLHNIIIDGVSLRSYEPFKPSSAILMKG